MVSAKSQSISGLHKAHDYISNIIMTAQTALNLLAQNIKTCLDKWAIQNQAEWIKYITGEMTLQDSEACKKKRNREYLLFMETECGKLKNQFLNQYMEADKDIQILFKKDLLSFFKSGEFAVLAVRKNSKELINIALESFEISIVSNNDIRDDITSLTLVYNSIKIMNLDGDMILARFAKKSDNPTA